MFDDYDSDVENKSVQSVAKKTKLLVEGLEKKPEVVHSSLEYHSIIVPPIVEYKSIEDYCESKTGSVAVVPVTNLRNISSPLVLKSPKPSTNVPPATTQKHPYCFFSVEELSLVTDLRNWMNKKVCPVGKVTYTDDPHECFLNSEDEEGSWKISLILLRLKKRPDSHKLVQVFGDMSVVEGQAKISVRFFRNLETVNVPLFLESYKLMQGFIPRCLPRLGTEEEEEFDSSRVCSDSSQIRSDDTCSDVE